MTDADLLRASVSDFVTDWRRCLVIVVEACSLLDNDPETVKVSDVDIVLEIDLLIDSYADTE